MKTKRYIRKGSGKHRADWWDYAFPAAYFITICTAGRRHYFGRVKEGRIRHTPAGAVADICWHQIKLRRKDVYLPAFCVMPNHIHGVIRIYQEVFDSERYEEAFDPEMRWQNIGADTISSIVGNYKAGVTRNVRRMGLGEFGWQPNFHDRIIRNEEEYDRIVNYIGENPRRWEIDRFYSRP